MTIELKYRNPVSGKVFHHYFKESESNLALDYLKDAQECGQEILIWRLLPWKVFRK